VRDFDEIWYKEKLKCVDVHIYEGVMVLGFRFVNAKDCFISQLLCGDFNETRLKERSQRVHITREVLSSHI
jgi:hypothetical protein